MREIVTAALAAILFLALGALHAVKAEVIASCGPLAGYKYFASAARGEPGWVEDRVSAINVFIRSEEKLDLIITGKGLTTGTTWTRSASDYGAPVVNVGGVAGEVMHIVVAWGAHTELYALDLKRKTLAVAGHKTGLLSGTLAMVGPCE